MPNLDQEILMQPTPLQWLEKANQSLEILLVDHALCERKAATTALTLINRYPDLGIQKRLSSLAREELLHFEQVVRLLTSFGFTYRNIRPSSYAKNLNSHISQEEPNRLKDQLLVCALIEARSCERFSALLPYVPKKIAEFYRKLHEAELRHSSLYLDLYTEIFEESWNKRIKPLSLVESEFITKRDPMFRFHSGI